VKISALAGVLICFLAAPELTKCQELEGEELKGLQRIDVLVEALNKVDDSMGSNRESLRDQILVALKRDIPKLKIVDTFTGIGPVTSELYLQITSFQAFKNSVADRIATFVELSLKRPALIIGDDGTKYFATATVWEKGTLVHDSIDHMSSRIRDQISQDMTAFAAEYYKQNP
jgi:hypothetical protein